MGIPKGWWKRRSAVQDAESPSREEPVSCMGTDPAGLARQLRRVAQMTPAGAQGIPSSPAIAALLERAVDPGTLRAEGRYTQPRTYGVYEVPDTPEGAARYHFGNHPVRKQELEREHGQVVLIAAFDDREFAQRLTTELNAL